MASYFNPTTANGFKLSHVVSCLQKAIRRQETRLAVWCAMEMWHSGYRDYVWKRLLTIAAEDCHGVITHEIYDLYRSHQLIRQGKESDPIKGRLFVAKAALLLSNCPKSRDADHATHLFYLQDFSKEEVKQAIEAAKPPKELPDYTHDVHTDVGKRRRKTRLQFFLEEFEALQPRQPGFFDQEVKKLKKGRIRLPKS